MEHEYADWTTSLFAVLSSQELAGVIEGVKTFQALKECMGGDKLSSFCNEEFEPPQVHIQSSDR